MGGILKHAPALSALLAPTVANSYKRLIRRQTAFRRHLGARFTSRMAAQTGRR